MVGLREKKKEIVRKNILDAAAKVFYTQGYEQASIAEIAQRANTGVGTCYNYFQSKANLFCESVLFVREDLWEQELDKIREKDLDNPTDIIMELIYIVLESVRDIEKPILREFLLGIGEMFIQDGEELVDFFKVFVERRYRVIEVCKEKGILARDVDTSETMICLFGICVTQIVNYSVKEDLTIEELVDSLRSKIELFFRGKILH